MTSVEKRPAKEYKKKSYKKKLRSKLVSKMINSIRDTGLSDDMTGFLLRTIHFHIPGYFLLLFLLLPIKYAPYALIPLLIPFIAFFYFQGCFLTIVEYKLCKNDLNIIDPYILAFSDDVTDDNRYKYTLGVSFVYFFIVFLILYFRYQSDS